MLKSSLWAAWLTDDRVSIRPGAVHSSSTLVGYRALSQGAAGIFFEVISARYETGSIIATSNKGFGEWGSLVGDPVLATAILDRLLHHATVLAIRGESYRLRDRTKQRLPGGLLPQATSAMAKGGEAEHHDPASYRL